MFAVARIDQGKTSRTVLVPRQAVIEDVNTNSYRVYVVDEKNAARMRVVQLAARQQGETVNILAGVKENERVATSNLGDLYDGAPVTFTGPGDRNRRGRSRQAAPCRSWLKFASTVRSSPRC